MRSRWAPPSTSPFRSIARPRGLSRIPRAGLAAGRYLSGLFKGGRARDLIEEAIAEVKREARAKGLTDSEIDAELRAWRPAQRF